MFTGTLMLGGVFSACSDYTIEPDPDVRQVIEESGEPDILVEPDTVSFDAVSVVDGEARTELVTVSNVGTAELAVSDLELDDPGAAFDLGVLSSVLVLPDHSAELAVTFEPTTDGAFEAVLSVLSNDPDEPVVEVLLQGEATAPVIEVDPLSFHFGAPYVGCELGQEVTITNAGTAVLLVDELEFSAASDELVLDLDEAVNGPLGWEVPAGETVSVWVDYAPLDEVQDIAYLKVHSNDPATPTVLATQEGGGVLYGTRTDSFEQPLNGPVDVLFALDWSCSMSDDIANVQANFDTFLDTLGGLDSDYHAAAVTADDGCFAEAGGYNYIDNTMSSELQHVTFDAFVNEGGWGTFTEAPLQLLANALSSTHTGSGGCNEGFYREAAALATISVSDEQEQSPNDYSYYVSLFQAMKSDTELVVMHAIAGDVPNGCGSADPGTGHYEATVATGGQFLSICSTDYGEHLESIAEGSVSENRVFELTASPVPETLEVRIDGSTVSSGWSWVESGNYVEFGDDHVPEPGATIDVSYALQADCEG